MVQSRNRYRHESGISIAYVHPLSSLVGKPVGLYGATSTTLTDAVKTIPDDDVDDGDDDEV